MNRRVRKARMRSVLARVVSIRQKLRMTRRVCNGLGISQVDYEIGVIADSLDKIEVEIAQEIRELSSGIDAG